MKEISLIIEGGSATAGPPLGPACGPLGINAGAVVAEINSKTAAFKGLKVPVKVIVDPKAKTYEIVIGSPAVAQLLKKKANAEKGNGKAWKEGTPANLSLQDAVEIAKSISSKSLGKTAKDTFKEVLGTALSMGFTVDSQNPKEIIKKVNQGSLDAMLK